MAQYQGLPTTSERNIRSRASVVIAPIYPEDAIRASQGGVAVAEILVNEGGSVFRVDILEAPSPSIAAAVVHALSLWQLEPATLQGKKSRFAGKITYYFVIKEGRGRVFAPDDAPYVGRWKSGDHNIGR